MKFFLFFLIFTGAFTLFPGEPNFQEDTDREGWEESGPSLDDDPVQLQVFDYYGRSSDQEMKIEAVKGLEQLAKEGRITNEDYESLELLYYLATEGISNRKVGLSSYHYSPETRLLACRTLGYIGGERSSEILLDVLKKDADVTVLAEAAFAIGKILEKPDKAAIDSFTRAIKLNTLIWHDNNLALSLISAVENISRRNKGISDVSLFLSILDIPNGPFTKAVKYKAIEAAKQLKDYDTVSRKQ
jgi:HEAT repeat protein